jgi:hypothetical protein
MPLITIAIKIHQGPLVSIKVEEVYIEDVEAFLILCQLHGLLDGFIVIKLERILIMVRGG